MTKTEMEEVRMRVRMVAAAPGEEEEKRNDTTNDLSSCSSYPRSEGFHAAISHHIIPSLDHISFSFSSNQYYEDKHVQGIERLHAGRQNTLVLLRDMAFADAGE
jgi:hypothetical protein